MHLQDFISSLAMESVRVMCDWDRLLDLNVLATVKTFSTSNAADLHTPWYLDDEGEIPYSEANSPPLRLREAKDRFDLLDEDRRFKINDIQGEGLLIGPVPCYSLPDGTVLLMDGNHRIASAFIFGTDLPFYGLVLHGPIDEAILPDLKFWT